MEPRGPELIARYKANYSIPGEAPITEQMVLATGNWKNSSLRERLVPEREHFIEADAAFFGSVPRSGVIRIGEPSGS